MFNKKLKEELKLEKEKNKELVDKVSGLLYNLSAQREKVPSYLITLLPMIYPNKSEEELYSIRERIINNIK